MVGAGLKSHIKSLVNKMINTVTTSFENKYATKDKHGKIIIDYENLGRDKSFYIRILGHILPYVINADDKIFENNVDYVVHRIYNKLNNKVSKNHISQSLKKIYKSPEYSRKVLEKTLKTFLEKFVFPRLPSEIKQYVSVNDFKIVSGPTRYDGKNILVNYEFINNPYVLVHEIWHLYSDRSGFKVKSLNELRDINVDYANNNIHYKLFVLIKNLDFMLQNASKLKTHAGTATAEQFMHKLREWSKRWPLDQIFKMYEQHNSKKLTLNYLLSFLGLNFKDDYQTLYSLIENAFLKGIIDELLADSLASAFLYPHRVKKLPINLFRDYFISLKRLERT